MVQSSRRQEIAGCFEGCGVSSELLAQHQNAYDKPGSKCSPYLDESISAFMSGVRALRVRTTVGCGTMVCAAELVDRGSSLHIAAHGKGHVLPL